MRKLSFVLFLVIAALPVLAQTEPIKEIGVDNILSLKSMARLDFEHLRQDGEEVETGWFALSANGRRIAFVSQDNTTFIWDYLDGFFSAYQLNGGDGLPAAHIYSDFNPVGDKIVSIYNDGQQYSLAYYDYGREPIRLQVPVYAPLPSALIPLNVWVSQEGVESIWMETTDAQGQYAVENVEFLDSGEEISGSSLFYANRVDETPESDLDAFVRIGRVPPPFAVTSSFDGVVKRWNLETGDVTAQAKVEGGPAVFGQINASGSHLAWRDTESNTLHLLNFESGEDKLVTELEGQYIQFMFLSIRADVIIGVNIDLNPIVVVWDVATGERYDLGEYRPCNRVPDMVRLSRDGTTLVIGCDTGLDIWRIQN